MAYRILIDDTFDFGYGARLLLVEEHPTGERKAFAKTITFEAIEPNALYPTEPTLQMNREELKNFLGSVAEEAWRRGWRPKESNDSHLADMRRLVFEELMPVVKGHEVHRVAADLVRKARDDNE